MDGGSVMVTTHLQNVRKHDVLLTNHGDARMYIPMPPRKRVSTKTRMNKMQISSIGFLQLLSIKSVGFMEPTEPTLTATLR